MTDPFSSQIDNMVASVRPKPKPKLAPADHTRVAPAPRDRVQDKLDAQDRDRSARLDRALGAQTGHGMEAPFQSFGQRPDPRAYEDVDLMDDNLDEAERNDRNIETVARKATAARSAADAYRNARAAGARPGVSSDETHESAVPLTAERPMLRETMVHETFARPAHPGMPLSDRAPVDTTALKQRMGRSAGAIDENVQAADRARQAYDSRGFDDAMGAAETMGRRLEAEGDTLNRARRGQKPLPPR